MPLGAGYRLLLLANWVPAEEPDLDAGHLLGGLIAALEQVVRASGGAWVGWSGSADDRLAPRQVDGLPVIPVPLSVQEVERAQHGFANSTVWPLYHDVIVAPEFHRSWWDSYLAVNQKFADIAAHNAGVGATVWVHDYPLQLVPGLLRRLRPDLRIGFFNNIPFPGYGIFAQLPWRRQIVTGLLGADLIGFQRNADSANFLLASRRAAGLTTRGDLVAMVERAGQDSTSAGRVSPPRAGRVRDGVRQVRVGTFPVAIDTPGVDQLARSDAVLTRAEQIRTELGDPEIVLLAVDRLDYTKGILHRLKAYAELLDSDRLGSARIVFVQVAGPSRERMEDYRILRHTVEREVGRINGDHAVLGRLAVHYLHQALPREELAALYRTADVMLVTPLRDGMNLVAKEYVACRYDETGVLVLSEFAGAADELGSALLVNPHNIDGLKDAIQRAVEITPREAKRRMRSMRKRVWNHDVTRWAASFLDGLQTAR